MAADSKGIMRKATSLRFVVALVVALLGTRCGEGACGGTAPDPPTALFSGVLEPGTQRTHEVQISELLNGDAVLRWSDPGTTLALGVRPPSCPVDPSPGTGCTFFRLAQPVGSPGSCVGNCVTEGLTPGQSTPLGLWRFVVENRSTSAVTYTLQVSLHHPRCT